jgi:hypothetical protein
LASKAVQASQSAFGKLGGFVKSGFKEAPLSMTTGAAYLGGPVVLGAARGADINATHKRGELAAERYLTNLQQMEQMRAERIHRATMENMARLAATAPHLYNELLAARSLPRGAVVIGGQPRTDVLEQVAMQQSLGHFQPSPSATDQFMASL